MLHVSSYTHSVIFKPGWVNAARAYLPYHLFPPHWGIWEPSYAAHCIMVRSWYIRVTFESILHSSTSGQTVFSCYSWFVSLSFWKWSFDPTLGSISRQYWCSCEWVNLPADNEDDMILSYFVYCIFKCTTLFHTSMWAALSLMIAQLHHW